MKTVVFAYHNMGCAGIEALLRSGFEIQAVFTYPDSSNEAIWFDSVAKLAARHEIPVYTPDDVNHPIWINKIKSLAPDVLFSFYYRDMLVQGNTGYPESRRNQSSWLIVAKIARPRADQLGTGQG